jgi:hypothetical protein
LWPDAPWFGFRGQIPSLGPTSGPACSQLYLVCWVYRTLVPHWVVDAALALSIGFYCFVLAAPHLQRRAVEVAVILAIGAYLAVVVMPGLLSDPVRWSVADANSIAQHELHLLALVQPGSAIAAGQNFFKELPFNYGLLMPAIISVMDLRAGPLTVVDQVRFVQICQVCLQSQRPPLISVIAPGAI